MRMLLFVMEHFAEEGREVLVVPADWNHSHWLALSADPAHWPHPLPLLDQLGWITMNGSADAVLKDQKLKPPLLAEVAGTSRPDAAVGVKQSSVAAAVKKATVAVPPLPSPRRWHRTPPRLLAVVDDVCEAAADISKPASVVAVAVVAGAVREPVAADRSTAVVAAVIGEAIGQPGAAVVAAAEAVVGSTAAAGWLLVVSVEPIAVPLPPNQMDLHNGQTLI